MTDAPPPYTPRPRNPAPPAEWERQVVVNPAARTGIIAELSGGVFDAFKTSPMLLLIVLLNMAFAGVGGYYLLKVEEYRSKDHDAMNMLLTKCLTETVHIDFLRMQSQQPKWSP